VKKGGQKKGKKKRRTKSCNSNIISSLDLGLGDEKKKNFHGERGKKRRRKGKKKKGKGVQFFVNLTSLLHPPNQKKGEEGERKRICKKKKKGKGEKKKKK